MMVLSQDVRRATRRYPTVMHICYDKSSEDCLAVKVCPFDQEGRYVEILLMGYDVDGRRCWLPPVVRRRSLTPCAIDDVRAMKQALEIAGRIARRLHTVDDPEQALIAMDIPGDPDTTR